jgi:hypothetical protein
MRTVIKYMVRRGFYYEKGTKGSTESREEKENQSREDEKN